MKLLQKFNKKREKVIIIALGLSMILNVYQFNNIKKERQLAELEHSQRLIDSGINDYCKGTISEEQLVVGVKSLPGISNALIEDYEGKKSFYWSWPDPEGGWRDSRLIFDLACSQK